MFDGLKTMLQGIGGGDLTTVPLEPLCGPIPSHATATTDEPWDAGTNEKRLKEGQAPTYYRRMYAWQDSGADGTTKAAYKFPHHMVGADGTCGAANVNACSAGIAVLNGGRGGANIPAADRQGVWAHLAAHQRAAGQAPPPLRAEDDLGQPLGRAFQLACSVPWAITEPWLQTILEVAARENLDPELLEKQRGVALENSHTVTLRGGVAVIPVMGPIARYMNLFTRISGGTSIDVLAQDLHTALQNPDVKAVVLQIDSPGGTVNGVAEFAQHVYEARAQKPVVAYIGGLGCSAAYWIASAASQIVVDPTAEVGSVGVVAAAPLKNPARSAREVEFVSSQSPNKRPNPATESGQAQIQALVDSLAHVFVETVARNRNQGVETVLQDFGRGGVLVGRQAVAAGMADGVGTLEGVLAQLQAGELPVTIPAPRPRRAAEAGREGHMALNDAPQGGNWMERVMEKLAMRGIAGEPGAPVTASSDVVPGNVEATLIPIQVGTTVDAEARRENEALRTQLRQLRSEKIDGEARAFVDAFIREEKAFKCERDAVVLLYTQVAAASELTGAIQLQGGQTTTLIGLLHEAFASRPAHQLTMDAIRDDVRGLIEKRQSEINGTASDDPNREPTPAERDELLAMTPLGRQILSERQNGGSH